jgi:predicted lipoprotein
MQKKVIQYGISAVLFVLIIINSIYIRKLSDIKAEMSGNEFDASLYALEYWEQGIIPAINNAIDFAELMNLLERNPDQAFSDHSHALGIGNIRYFMVKGDGKVVSVNENNVTLAIQTGDKQTEVQLETEFVYGNAIRDAVGAINLAEFPNTMHLNQVSAEVNKIIRQQVIPPFLKQVKNNSCVKFAGAIELNQKYLDLNSIEIIPVSIEASQQ